MAEPVHKPEDFLQPLGVVAGGKLTDGPAKEDEDFFFSRVTETYDAVEFLNQAREDAETQPEPARSEPPSGGSGAVFASVGGMAPPKLALLQMEAEEDAAKPKHALGHGISKSLPLALSAEDGDSPAPGSLGKGLGALADATDDSGNQRLTPKWVKPIDAALGKAASELDDLAPLARPVKAQHGDSLLNGVSGDGVPEATINLIDIKDMHIDELLRMTGQLKGSDLHITVGLPPMVRQDGRVIPLPCEVVDERLAQRLIYDVLNEEQIEKYERTKELDFSYGVKGLGRYRFNVYRQRACVGAAMRVIPHIIPTLESLRLPPVLRELTHRHSGLILVTGPTGSGKSTTIAAMIDVINSEREVHIMTIEDPVEYLHAHKRSMVNQRELGADTLSFNNALRAVLREDPDVILVGEMRDLETVSAAITLAETGHLVFGTLHTRSASATIDRVVDVFPSHQQDQIRTQLSTSLESVVAQQLLPKIGGGRVAAIEVMIATSAVRNLIREGKTFQINSVIETGAQFGMQAMDRVLADPVPRGDDHAGRRGAALQRPPELRPSAEGVLIQGLDTASIPLPRHAGGGCFLTLPASRPARSSLREEPDCFSWSVSSVSYCDRRQSGIEIYSLLREQFPFLWDILSWTWGNHLIAVQ